MYNLEAEDILVVDFWDSEEILEDLVAILDKTESDAAGLRFAFVFAEKAEGQPAMMVSILW